MKAKKQTVKKLIATVKFEVFEKEDGSFDTVLTSPKGILQFAAINLLERHLYKVRAWTQPPVKESK